VSDHHLSRAADAARTLGVRVHTHAAEDMHQTEVSLETRGITPIEGEILRSSLSSPTRTSVSPTQTKEPPTISLFARSPR
jgi:hypothetical protein